MAVCTVTLALTLRICFQVDSGQREELRTDTRLQDLVFATFGAVFCLQGKLQVEFTCFKHCFCIKMCLCLNPNLDRLPITKIEFEKFAESFRDYASLNLLVTVHYSIVDVE